MAASEEKVLVIQTSVDKFSFEFAKLEKKNAEVVSVPARLGEHTQRQASRPQVGGPAREGQHAAIPSLKPRFESSPPLNNGNGSLSAEMGVGERKILVAIAQHEGGISREHITVLTGYRRSSRDTYIQRLRARGYLNLAGKFLVATQEGIGALGADYDPLPTGEALREKLMRTLPEGEKRLLGILIEAYPNEIDRETLSNAANYQRSSRDT